MAAHHAMVIGAEGIFFRPFAKKHIWRIKQLLGGENRAAPALTTSNPPGPKNDLRVLAEADPQRFLGSLSSVPSLRSTGREVRVCERVPALLVAA